MSRSGPPVEPAAAVASTAAAVASTAAAAADPPRPPTGAAAASADSAFHALASARLAAEVSRLAAHEMQMRMSRSGKHFEPGPPRGFSHWHVLGEVVKLRGFDEEELSVAYEMDLRTPTLMDLSAADALNVEDGIEGQVGLNGQRDMRAPMSSPWTAQRGTTLEGISRDSAAMWAPQPTVACGFLSPAAQVKECWVGMHMEFSLRTRSDAPALQPILYFSVWARNRWGMRSVVGYAFVHLPRDAGLHELTLKTWRTRGRTPPELLDDFFLGAAHGLEDVRRVGVPPPEKLALQGGVSNRLGGPVIEESGEVHLRLELVQIEAPTADVATATATSTDLTQLQDQTGAAALAASVARMGLSSSGAGARDTQREQERNEIAALRQRSRTAQTAAALDRS